MLWSERDSSPSTGLEAPGAYPGPAVVFQAAGDTDAGGAVQPSASAVPGEVTAPNDGVGGRLLGFAWPRDAVIDEVLAVVATATGGQYGVAERLSFEEVAAVRVGLFGARARYLGPVGAFCSWSGLESAGLRASMRMTVREFGEHLGVGDRLISYWEGLGVRCQPRPANQIRLDQALAVAGPVVRQRFARELEDRYVILARTVQVAP